MIETEISVVVPMLDAEHRIASLHRRLAEVVSSLDTPAEIVFVDDGSTDRTWDEVCRITTSDPRVRGIRLRRNVGQPAALCAGFSTCRGSIVVMMDDDLETDPSELPRFVKAVQEGADFASGWREGTRPAWRAFGSFVFNQRMRRWDIPFHDSGCGFDAMTAPIASQLAERGWSVRGHRFKFVVAEITEQITEVRVPVRPTAHSHYDAVSLATAWLDVELAFGNLTPNKFLALGTAAPILAGVLIVSLGAKVGVRRRTMTTARVMGSSCAAIGAFSAHLLVRRQRLERASRSGQPWEIMERTGSPMSTRMLR